MTAVPRQPALRLLSIIALCTSAAVACGHDSSNTTGPPSSANGFSIAIDSGSNLQIVVVGHTVHVAVTLSTSSGGSIGGQTATWLIASGGGTVASASTVTDANGRTSNDWTLGTTSGENTVTVSAAGVAVTINATGAADALHGLIKVSSDSQTVVASSSTAFVVRAVDQFNNPVPGIDVVWAATGGALTPVSTTTGNSGNAQVTFTTDTLPATYTVTATATGFAPVTFTLTGK